MKKGGQNPQIQGLMDFQKLKQYPEALPLMNGNLKTKRSTITTYLPSQASRSR